MGLFSKKPKEPEYDVADCEIRCRGGLDIRAIIIRTWRIIE